jgi:hypothetical protein
VQQLQRPVNTQTLRALFAELGQLIWHYSVGANRAKPPAVADKGLIADPTETGEREARALDWVSAFVGLARVFEDALRVPRVERSTGRIDGEAGVWRARCSRGHGG